MSNENKPPLYSLEWHVQQQRRAASTAQGDNDGDGFPDHLGGSSGGASLPEGIEFKQGLEVGSMEIWDVSDENNEIMLASFSRDGAMLPDTVKTGSGSYGFGDKHSLGSAGEQAGFINQISNIFYAPAIWEAISSDGQTYYQSQRRLHGKLESTASSPSPSANLMEWDWTYSPTVNFVIFKFKARFQAYTGEVYFRIYEQGKEVGALKTNIASNGSDLTEVNLKYPLYLAANSNLRWKAFKEDGSLIMAAQDSLSSSEPYLEYDWRSWEDIQPVLGTKHTVSEDFSVQNVHYQIDSLDKNIDINAKDQQLSNFELSINDAAGFTATVNLSDTDTFTITHSPCSYQFFKHGSTWEAINKITAEKVNAAGGSSTDNKAFFGSSGGGAEVISGKVIETDNSPSATSLSANTFTTLGFTTSGVSIESKPSDMTEGLWVSNKFNLDKLVKGDSVEFEVEFEVTPSVNGGAVYFRSVHTETSGVNSDQYLGRLSEGAGVGYTMTASFVKNILHDDAVANDVEFQVKCSQGGTVKLTSVKFIINRRNL